MKHKIVLALAVVASFVAFADTEVVNGVEWTYRVENDKSEVYGTYAFCASKSAIPRSTSGDLTIPSQLGGYPVTSIGDGAFFYCSSLTSVTVPSGVKRVGDRVFEGCSALKSVTIPSSVTSIGDRAFSECSGLTSILVDGQNGNYASVNGVLYDKAVKVLLVCPEGLTSVAIPSGVKSIGRGAFSGCSGLTSVIIPSSVTYIGDYAFSGCSGLTSVAIPSSVTSIGDSAFYDCGGLTSVAIPSSVTDIGDSAFYGCSGLTSVAIPSSVTSIGSCSFCRCSGLKSVTIPSSVTSIGGSAFSSCSGLTSVTISLGVKSIGRGAFSYCERLTSVSIPSSVTSIGGGAFSECNGLTSILVDGQNGNYASINGVLYDKAVKSILACPGGLTSVTIPTSVTSIGDSAFEGCRGLTSVTIPSSVTNIGDYAFYYCSGLTSMTIPLSVTSIGREAFCGCRGLTSVTIPSSVTSIGVDAFYGCSGLGDGVVIVDGCVLTVNGTCPSTVNLPTETRLIAGGAFSVCEGLTSVTIPEGVTSIGSGAFSECIGLTSVMIPASVTNIGSRVFSCCERLTSILVDGQNGNYASVNGVLYDKSVKSLLVCPEGLTSVTIPSSVTNIGEYAFRGCSGLTSVTIPSSVTSIGRGAFAYCERLTSLTIPLSVTSIGGGAFYYCESLTSVTIPEGVTSIDGDFDYDGYVGMFSDCSGLTSVTIPSSVTNIGESAFSGCNSVKTIYVGTGGGNYAQRKKAVVEMLENSGFNVSGVTFAEAGEGGGMIGGEFDGSKKHVFSGVAKDEDGEMCGLAQITTAKATSKGVKVSGFVMAADGKKYTLKAQTASIEDGFVSVSTTAGKLGAVAIVVGEDGFRGEFVNGMTIVSTETDGTTGILSGTVKLNYFNENNKLVTKSLTVAGTVAEGVASGMVGEKKKSVKSFVAEIVE